ncbi:MAG: hypothetical protein AAF386_01460 [Pseudomonadota bacterium]
MTHSYLVEPTRSNRGQRSGLKDMAMFGLRKAFIDPAPKPRKSNPRVARFIGDESGAMDFWLPE